MSIYSFVLMFRLPGLQIIIIIIIISYTSNIILLLKGSGKG